MRSVMTGIEQRLEALERAVFTQGAPTVQPWEEVLRLVRKNWAGAEATYQLAVSSVLTDLSHLTRSDEDVPLDVKRALLAQIHDVCRRLHPEMISDPYVVDGGYSVEGLLRVATQTGSVLSGDPLLLHQAGNYALGWLIDTYNTESPQEPSGG